MPLYSEVFGPPPVRRALSERFFVTLLIAKSRKSAAVPGACAGANFTLRVNAVRDFPSVRSWVVSRSSFASRLTPSVALLYQSIGNLRKSTAGWPLLVGKLNAER